MVFMIRISVMKMDLRIICRGNSQSTPSSETYLILEKATTNFPSTTISHKTALTTVGNREVS